MLKRSDKIEKKQFRLCDYCTSSIRIKLNICPVCGKRRPKKVKLAEIFGRNIKYLRTIFIIVSVVTLLLFSFALVSSIYNSLNQGNTEIQNRFLYLFDKMITRLNVQIMPNMIKILQTPFLRLKDRIIIFFPYIGNCLFQSVKHILQQMSLAYDKIGNNFQVLISGLGVE